MKRVGKAEDEVAAPLTDSRPVRVLEDGCAAFARVVNALRLAALQAAS